MSYYLLLLQYIRYRTPFSVRILRVDWPSGLFNLSTEYLSLVELVEIGPFFIHNYTLCKLKFELTIFFRIPCVSDRIPLFIRLRSGPGFFSLEFDPGFFMVGFLSFQMMNILKTNRLISKLLRLYKLDEKISGLLH